MLRASKCVELMTGQGLGPFIGVPCSLLKPLINRVIEDPRAEYIAASNEGEAVAIAAGAWLAGRKPVVMFQNSGLGNAVNPLTSLHAVFRIPLLMIVTWRGEPGRPDEPQHRLMGEITPALLDCLRIPHALFPDQEDQLEERLEEALRTMDASGLSYALILQKGVVEKSDPTDTPKEENTGTSSRRKFPAAPGPDTAAGLLRREAIAAAVEAAGSRALLVATTGGTARELFELRDRPGNMYVVGSMGCASSLALGVALYAKHRPIVVLDGDGAALMRLEAMVSIGHYAPPNLIHIVLDNGVYDSTGGQRTLSGSVDFCGLALACGYRTAASVAGAKGLAGFLEAAIAGDGPHFIHARIRPGAEPGLGRPTLAPPEVARRFRAEILGNESKSK